MFPPITVLPIQTTKYDFPITILRFFKTICLCRFLPDMTTDPDKKATSLWIMSSAQGYLFLFPIFVSTQFPVTWSSKESNILPRSRRADALFPFLTLVYRYGGRKVRGRGEEGKRNEFHFSPDGRVAGLGLNLEVHEWKQGIIHSVFVFIRCLSGLSYSQVPKAQALLRPVLLVGYFK